MSFHVVIPARFQSSRLPSKVLLDIAGKPMVQHVYEKARATQALSVCIATDDQRIFDVVKGFGGDCIMTSVEHKSGTDRIAEVVRIKQWDDKDVVVNIQGDEPLIPPANIQQCAQLLQSITIADMATLATPIDNIHDYFDPNVVKVAISKQQLALYFSRAAIPWHRDHLAVNRASMPPASVYYRHIGIYAYRCGFLHRYVNYGVCELEMVESLEQLRALWHGHQIAVELALEEPGHGVDTEDDLLKVRNILG